MSFNSIDNQSIDGSSSNLFVWSKKIELQGFSVQSEKKRQREHVSEIENLKKRREERSIQKSQHEKEKELLSRQRATLEFQETSDDKQFELNQSKARSEIRIREGRVQPIDILYKQLTYVIDNDSSHSADFKLVNMEPPYMVFNGLTLKELEEVRQAIQIYVDSDRETPTHVEYWESLMVLCHSELRNKKDRFQERGGMHSSIADDVENFFQGKSRSELEKLQTQIQSHMEAGTAKVVEYIQLPLYKAKAFLKEFHNKLMMLLKQQQPEVIESSPRVKLLDSPSSHQVHDNSRKPKYLNRVHSGYEWNKYNRTHYDSDNPPPKIVHGYKFNIFYPDLIDKKKSPMYTIEEDRNSNGEVQTETCIIRFHAGSPYQDIAFRIVNREWEFSRKKGFKCTFDCGILRLYFNFKRCPYRR